MTYFTATLELKLKLKRLKAKNYTADNKRIKILTFANFK